MILVSLTFVKAEMNVLYSPNVEKNRTDYLPIAMATIAVIVSIGSIIIQLISHLHNLQIQQKIHTGLSKEFIKPKISWAIGSTIILIMLILVVVTMYYYYSF